MREEISAARNDCRQPHQAFLVKYKRSNQRGSTLPQMTEVTRILEQKWMTLKTSVLQCQNGIVA